MSDPKQQPARQVAPSPAPPVELAKATEPKPAPRYTVVAALAITRSAEGVQTYVYRNGVVPAGTSPKSIKHLLDTGLIAPVVEA